MALGTAGAASAAPASESPAGSIGLRLLDAPVAATDDPRARVYIVDHLAPGTVIERRIQVTNTTASAVDVSLYAAAAGIADGSFQGAEGHTANELSSWTSINPSVSSIPAGDARTATVTITVPADAPPGEQYGVVWAEVTSDPAAGGITQVSRVGIRLYVSVGPGGAPAADFTIDSLTATRPADGHPIVLATVHNTGGRALDLSGTLTLADGPGALSAGPFDAVLGTTLAIGDTEPVTIPLDDQLPAGPWKATITLHSGLVEHIQQATLTFPDTGAADPVATTDTGAPWWVNPTIIGAACMLLLLLAVVLRTLRRRRRRTRGRHATPSRPAKPADEQRPPVPAWVGPEPRPGPTGGLD
jgi:MYXO-CTERM domain-containing protein